MKRVVSRLLTLLLSVSMLLTFMPAMAFADDEVSNASGSDALQEENEEVAEEVPEAEEAEEPVAPAEEETEEPAVHAKEAVKTAEVSNIDCSWGSVNTGGTTTAGWDNVEDADYYLVQATFTSSSGTTATSELANVSNFDARSDSCEFESFFESNGIGEYGFTVKAYKYGEEGESDTLIAEGSCAEEPFNIVHLQINNPEGGWVMFGTDDGATNVSLPGTSYFMPVKEDVVIEVTSVEYGWILGGIAYSKEGESGSSGGWDYNLTLSMEENSEYTITVTFTETTKRVPVTLVVGDDLSTQYADGIATAINSKDSGAGAMHSGNTITYNAYDGTTERDMLEWLEDVIKYNVSGIVYLENLYHTHPVGLKPMNEYGSEDDLEADLASTKVLKEGETFYLLWNESVTELDVTIDAPVCGTEVTAAEYTPEIRPMAVSDELTAKSTNTTYDPFTQKPKPEVTVEGDKADVAKMEADEDGSEDTWCWWETEDEEDTYLGYPGAFTGTIKGGTSYNAFVVLIPAFGYYFGDVNLTVNGEDPADYAEYDSEYIILEAPVTAEHDWGDWKVVKKATTTATGLKERKCKHCDAVEQKVIPKLSAANTVLVAKAKAKGKKKGVISWNDVDADRYVVYMAKCDFNETKGKYKKVKTLSGSKTKFTTKKLKKNKFYKFKVVAQKKVNGKYKTVATSYVGHFCTNNVRGSFTNPKSMKLNKTKVTLKKGGTVKLSAKVTKVKKSKKLATTHAKLLRFKSSDPDVATVNSKGKVTAKSAGTATIYVQTINGMWKTCKVTVK